MFHFLSLRQFIWVPIISMLYGFYHLSRFRAVMKKKLGNGYIGVAFKVIVMQNNKYDQVKKESKKQKGRFLFH